MGNRFRASRQVILLGTMILLAILVLALPRPASNAQEPAKVADKKALRDQIIALHVEIDLLEIEQGADRQALADLIKEERAIRSEWDSWPNSNRSFLLQQQKDNEDLKSWVFGCLVELSHTEPADIEKWKKSLAADEKDEFKDQLTEKLGENVAKEWPKQLASFMNSTKEEFPKAQKHLVEWFFEQSVKKATEGIREKSAHLKKNLPEDPPKWLARNWTSTPSNTSIARPDDRHPTNHYHLKGCHGIGTCHATWGLAVNRDMKFGRT